MAPAAVHNATGSHGTSFEPLTTVQSGVTKHHVHTKLNYHKPNEDGSPPAPTYVGKPETYERPFNAVDVTLYNFPSHDKDFLDDDKIKAEYYPETERLLKEARHQIINVWRPIKPIYKDPLGVADAKSVFEEDLIPISLIYPNRHGETLAVLPNKEHRWYYAYGQLPEEVLLIKCYDSKTDGRARRVPHTAFSNLETEGAEARESIEFRALVFHEDEPAE